MTLARDERGEAHEELAAQAHFYEREHAGLGIDFLDAVDASIEAIAEFPDAWRPYPGWDREPLVRVKQVQGFPVGIVYFVDGGTLVIVAYAHHQRDAAYWASRTSASPDGSGR
ncbi:MAG: type II toxin-antitoxin system RelE/ParE family toxin [Pseudolysinimonas sp.]